MTDVDCVATIRALEALRRIAMRTADTEALRELFDECLVYIHSTGARHSLVSFLDKLAHGAISYGTLTLGAVEIQARERFALLCGMMEGTIHTTVGTLAVANHYEAAWMKCAGSWPVAAIQGFKPHIDKDPTP
jgi:hypothetical protein